MHKPIELKAEEKLQEKEELYRTIFENTGTATVIFEENATISLANAKFAELVGYTIDEIEKKKKWTEFVVEEDLEMMKTRHRLRRIDPDATPKSYEFRAIDRYGGIRNILLTIDVILGTNQRVASLLDITANKRVEEALKNSELKYRNIFENAIEGIYQSTIEGRITTANAAFARMAGYDSPEELIESIKDIGDQLYVHPEDRKKFLEIRDAKGFVDDFEVEFYKKDGSKFFVVINSRTVKDEQGKILYLEGLIEDITIRKHAEKQLLQTLDRLRKAVITTIQVLVSAVESRDPYTACHQLRVADLARAIATELGLSQ